MSGLVSVVIPTYNRSEELKRALRSVLSQTYKNLEVIIVDNNSTDGTDTMLKDLNDQRIRLLKINNNGVIAASRNLGVKHANGKYIAFLDSDDWWTSQKLELSVRALESGADVIYHDMLLTTKLNQIFFLRRVWSRRLAIPVFKDLLLKGNTIITSSVVVKKIIFNKINGFQESQDLVTVEDYDAWLHLSKVTNNFEKIPKALGYYWIGGGNTSNIIKTARALHCVKKSHNEEILCLNLSDKLYWFDYVEAMALYALGEKEKAKQRFEININNGPNLRIKFRCMAMITTINIKLLIEKFFKKKRSM